MAESAGTNSSPGFVQNCPAPNEKEARNPVVIASARWAAAAAVTKTGLTLPSSPKNGIGTGRDTARSKSARPPASEPVKAPALIRGSSRPVRPASSPWMIAKAPLGAPASCSVVAMMSAVASDSRR